MQSRAMSLAEACISTGFAFLLSILVQDIVFKLYCIEVTAAENISIVCIFTAVSVVRSFISRRIFNYLGEKPLTYMRGKMRWIFR